MFNFINNSKSIKIISILILPLLIKILFEFYILGYRFIDDTQGSYSYYQYIYNYFLQFKEIPLWINYIDGGLPSVLPLHFESSLFSYFFIVVGGLLKLNPYLSYLSLLFFINLIFLFG